MAPNKPMDEKYLTLNVKDGFGFGYLKNVLLRVSPTFEGKRLISDYVYPLPQPVFNLNFVWCATASQLKNLQVSRSIIQIEIWASNSEKNWKIGYAVLGVQHAQFVRPNEPLYYRRLPLRDAKTKFGVFAPELFVTLSIQHNTYFNAEDKIYLANLINPLESPAQAVGENIRSPSNTVTTKRKKEKIQQYPDHKSLKTKSQPSKDFSNQKEVPKGSISASCTASAEFKTKPTLTAEETPVVADSKSPTTSSNLEENQNKFVVPFHQYCLEMHFGSIDWYTTIRNMKISVRFCNPVDNNVVTAVEKEDVNLLQLVLSYSFCRMYYVCIPDNLLKTVMRDPPQILIVKAKTSRVVAMGGVKIKHLQIDPKMDQFKSYILLIAKNKEVLGKITVTITFQDLGILSAFTNIRTTECFTKFNRSQGDEDDVTNDLEKLLKVHERLKISYDKIQTGFDAITQKLVNEHILRHRHQTNSEKVDSDSPKDAAEEKCRYRPTDDRTKRVSFSPVPVQYHCDKEDNKTGSKLSKGILKETLNMKPRTAKRFSKNFENSCSCTTITKKEFSEPTRPINVAKHLCEMCGQDLEIIFDKNVGQNNESIFWCKNCKTNSYSSSSIHNRRNRTSKVFNLKQQSDEFENGSEKETDSPVSRNEYEYLAAAQHYLTMLLINAESDNKKLESKYSEATKEVEKLKENMFVTEIKSYVRTYTQALKEEIDNAKYKNGLNIKIIESKEQVQPFKETQKNKEMEFSSRKDRCEACKVLQKRKSSSGNKLKQSKIENNLDHFNKENRTSNQCFQSRIYEMRKQMNHIHSKLEMYLEKRDELIRVNHYTSDNPEVIYMTHTINGLSAAWFNLRIELESLISN